MHDEDEAFAVLLQNEAALFDTEQPQVIRPSAFHEMQIAGMIDHTGKVGVFVIDPLHEPMARLGQ